MTKEDLAALLNGRQYRDEITPEEEALASDAGLVVMFGASDDLAELRGAIKHEFDVYDGEDIVLMAGRVHDFNLCPCDCEHAQRANAQARERGKGIKPRWCEIDGYDWAYETAIPHATFSILEDDEKYCRGIVFELAEVAG